jgi:hypothetical protein
MQQNCARSCGQCGTGTGGDGGGGTGNSNGDVIDTCVDTTWTCSSSYNPRCDGSTGRTFLNRCYAACNGVASSTAGVCGGDSQDGCRQRESFLQMSDAARQRFVRAWYDMSTGTGAGNAQILVGCPLGRTTTQAPIIVLFLVCHESE